MRDKKQLCLKAVVPSVLLFLSVLEFLKRFVGRLGPDLGALSFVKGTCHRGKVVMQISGAWLWHIILYRPEFTRQSVRIEKGWRRDMPCKQQESPFTDLNK